MEGGWSSAIQTALTSTAGEVTTLFAAILTVALGIFAFQWGVRKALKFFKSTTN